VGLRQDGIPLSQKSETFLKVFPQGEDVSEGLGHKTKVQHNNERKYFFFFFLHSILTAVLSLLLKGNQTKVVEKCDVRREHTMI
jgi:hypothetical protein